MSRKNIFTIHQDYEKKPDRNTFDLSFANNLTLKFGALTPVFCKECVPGDSFRIKPSCALQFMPMAFPVQTPMRAYLHFFKTRNRTMWKDWMDFISGTKSNLVHPYVHPTDKKKFYRVGGLADYLGIPNVLYKSESSSSTRNIPIDGATMSVTTSSNKTINYNAFVTTAWVDYNFVPYIKMDDLRDFYTEYTDKLDSIVSSMNSRLVGNVANSTFTNLNPNLLPNPWNAVQSEDAETIGDSRLIPFFSLGKYEYESVSMLQSIHVKMPLNVSSLIVTNVCMRGVSVIRSDNDVIQSVLPWSATFTRSTDSDNDITLDFDIPTPILESGYNVEFLYIPQFGWNSYSNQSNSVNLSSMLKSDVIVSIGANISADVTNIGELDSTPYDSEIRLNAFPFRAYECIYNAYYRNSVNDPFKPDGVTPEYNKFNTTYEGGADSTQYDLYYRNWEYDFLTSAVPTPQFGNAPLVGLTSTGAATLEDGNGNRFIVQAQLDSDGEITGWTTSKENDPSGSLRMLMNMATTGISINDLRNVNAYQRFLENAIRKGLSYRDQILAHYGVSVRYDELDMPEFIGGCSTFVDMNKINQLSEGGSTPLGSFVGQATAMMSGKHDITEYCDEHGFIIGILSIVPMPVYSQLLPKHFTHAEQLDYYFPEFKHVGYQPIAQKEVSPLQTFYSGGDLNKTFGYNRAYYDLIASTDEVHGQFRTTMRDFIMNRTFENEPVLGGDFLHVDPDQLNDVFLAGDLESSDGSNIYAADSDKIIGSLYFDVQKKSPISLYGIAKLE